MAWSIYIFITVATAVFLFGLTVYFAFLARVTGSKVAVALSVLVGSPSCVLVGGLVGGLVNARVGVLVNGLVSVLVGIPIIGLLYLLVRHLVGSDSLNRWWSVVAFLVAGGLLIIFFELFTDSKASETFGTLAAWIEDSIQRVGALETWIKIITVMIGILTVVSLILGAIYKAAKDMVQKDK